MEAKELVAWLALGLGLYNLNRDRPRIKLELRFEEFKGASGRTFPTPVLWVRNVSRHDVRVDRVEVLCPDSARGLRPNRSDRIRPSDEIKRSTHPDLYVLPPLSV